METAVAQKEARILFGQPNAGCEVSDGSLCLNLRAPVLGGSGRELLLPGDEESKIFTDGEFGVLEHKARGMIAGVALCRVPGSIEPEAYRIFHDLLRLTEGYSLYRMWNFVPRINAESEGLEHYRSFNIGRWRAFEECYGEIEMESHLPAASAVGLDDDCLAVVFLAGKVPVNYFENPRQTPAYHYPADYGPRSPSFARGAVVSLSGHRIGYLSGTSSICGHETVGEDDLALQFDTTIDNIDAVLEPMGFDGALDPEAPLEAQYRVYVRDPADYEEVRERFENVVGREAADRTTFIQADICRAPLRLEIEGIFAD